MFDTKPFQGAFIMTRIDTILRHATAAFGAILLSTVAVGAAVAPGHAASPAISVQA